MKTSETWKSIPTLPTFEASDLGRVRNTKTLRIYSQCWINGRLAVQIDANNIRTTRHVKSLVYEAFHGKQPRHARIEVCNGNEQDVRLVNLRCSGKRSMVRFEPHLRTRKSFREVTDEIWKDVLQVA